MSYSRWSNSDWYVYPTSRPGKDKEVIVECWLARGPQFTWEPVYETLEVFMSEVEAHEEVSEDQAKELRDILQRNEEDVRSFLK